MTVVRKVIKLSQYSKEGYTTGAVVRKVIKLRQ
jgi:hypothetical protein